jgi:preprotein translocase subunit SecG
MTITILNVVYVIVAIAMVVLILMQRGAGAQAGSGFGGGASATVFGARGAGNFLSKATKWLAVAFFVLSLGIGMFITRGSVAVVAPDDLGIMGGAAAPAETPAPAGDVPAAPAGDAPAAAAPATDVPAAPPQPATDTPPPAQAPNGGGNR